MAEDWRNLRVGDRIRIVRMPSEFDKPGYCVPPMTRRLYKKLIARRRPVRVYEIDEYGRPWIGCQFRDRNGNWEYHALCVDDDSWVRVKKRTYLNGKLQAVIGATKLAIIDDSGTGAIAL
ncbi:MAG: hypothetical protein WD738_08875 [Pirellulales bacterium]